MGPGHSVCVISLLLFHQALAISSSSHGYASTQVSSSHQGLASEVFDETLTIRPLADGKLSTNFEFTITLREEGKTNTRNLSQESHHFTLVPLSLGQLLRVQSVSEMHLNLNAGKWDYKAWGFPENPEVASGAELRVWMEDLTRSGQRWKDLVNGLSGLFCASLGGLDEKRTTSPTLAFFPEGVLPSDGSNRLLHAFLPSESVCTENLTPFLKLLPCKSRSGIASLLNPHRLFDADWHGIGVHVTSLEDGTQIRLTFGAVFDPVRLSHHSGLRDWTFESLFDRTISRACPVASHSTINVFLPLNEPYQLSPEPSSKLPGQKHVQYNVQDVTAEKGPLNVSMQWPPTGRFNYPPPNPSTQISVQRVLTGASQSRGGLAYKFTNPKNSPQTIVCIDTAPWFVNYFLNTRKFQVNGVAKDDLVSKISYIPTKGHSPSLLEAVLVLPANSVTQLTMEFSKSFIAYTEHPPDAERGWDLPAAVISYEETRENEGDTRERRIYTKNLLINLPTPDFSMPYNVIIMTSTVITLFFGSIFNLLTRQFVWVKSPKGT